MKKFFSETLNLGPNWETTVWGFLALLMGSISVKPDLVDFLPDSIKGYVIGAANLMTFVSGGTFAAKVKTGNVTGGDKPATEEAKNRIEEDKK